MNIAQLRKKYPKRKLGYRETSILNAKGARVSKARDLPGCYKVKAGNRFFAFTKGKKGYADYTVIL